MRFQAFILKTGALAMGIRLLSILLVASSITPASKPSPTLAGIAHVAFRVSDVAKSREFYQQLGFEQSFEFNDPGKPPVSYMKVNDTQFIELYQRNDETQPLGLMHVCYEATDIAAVQKEYVQHEIKAPEPRKARAGNMLLVFRDPEDQTVEFTQYMPGSLHFEDRGKHLAEHRIGSHLARATINVRDLPAERSFYSDKLGFEDLGAKSAGRLRVPGAAADEIELDASSQAKTRIALSVSNLGGAADELRHRGLTVQNDADAISVTDPDGAIIMFIRR